MNIFVHGKVVFIEIDRLALGDHAAMAVDFKGEGWIFLFREINRLAYSCSL